MSEQWYVEVLDFIWDYDEDGPDYIEKVEWIRNPARAFDTLEEAQANARNKLQVFRKSRIVKVTTEVGITYA